MEEPLTLVKLLNAGYHNTKVGWAHNGDHDPHRSLLHYINGMPQP